MREGVVRVRYAVPQRAVSDARKERALRPNGPPCSCSGSRVRQTKKGLAWPGCAPRVVQPIAFGSCQKKTSAMCLSDIFANRSQPSAVR